MANRPVNVSQYIANLNSIDDSGSSPTAGTSLQYAQINQRSPHDDDLAIFSNTQFFDFDIGCSTDITASVDNMLMQQEQQLQSKALSSVQSSSSSSSNMANGPVNEYFDPQLNMQQYSLANDLLLTDPTFMGKSFPAKTPHNAHTQPRLSGLRGSPALNSMINTTLSTRSSSPLAEFSAPANFTTSSSSGSSTPATPVARRRKSSETSDVRDDDEADGLDETQRALAEEDKRRRNTAASARFRIKKKMREQQMERTTKDLQDKVQLLESKIVQLEMENKWLKNLVVEKNDARDSSDLMDMKSRIMARGLKREL